MTKTFTVYSASGELYLAHSKSEIIKKGWESELYLDETGLSKFSGKMKPALYLPKLFGKNSWGIQAKENKHKIIGGFRSREDAVKAIRTLLKNKRLKTD